MKIVIPDDFPAYYQGHAQLDRLSSIGEVTLFDSKASGPAELRERLAGAEAAINVRAYSIFDADLFRACPDLKLISIVGTGTDNVDLNAASEHGVIVSNCPGANALSVAEHTIALLFAVAKSVALTDRRLRAGEWYHRKGYELHGKTIGLVGLGAIGQHVARLARGLGMRVLAWSLNQDPARAASVGAEVAELDDLLRRSDVVSLHLRASEQTANLLGQRELDLMKPGAILVNTARAAIVDEAALVAALRSDKLFGAGLDVYPKEPLPPDSPLRELDNVVITPHLAWITDNATERLAAMPVDNVEAFKRGEPAHVVNLAALEHPRYRR